MGAIGRTAIGCLVASGALGQGWGQAPISQPAGASVLANSAPVALTGLPLPLKEGEALAPFANGCARLVQPAPALVELKPFVDDGSRETNWIGACRFGLANGEGMTVQAGGIQVRRRYRYGLEVGGKGEIWYGSAASASHGTFKSWHAPGRVKSMLFVDWEIGNDQPPQEAYGGHARKRSLIIVHSLAPLVISRFAQRWAECPVKGRPQPVYPVKFSAKQLQFLKENCASVGRQAYVQFTKVETLPPGQSNSDGSTERLLGWAAGMCSQEADCSGAWINLVNYTLAHIDPLRASLQASSLEAINDINTRYAPLESGFYQRYRAAAASSAAARAERKGVKKP